MKKAILFLILSLGLLSNCDKKTEESKKNKVVVKTKSYEELPEINFSNTEMEKGEKAILFYMENPRKFNLYAILLESYSGIFSFDNFYGVYSTSFLNEKKKFNYDEDKVFSFNLLAVNALDENEKSIENFKSIILTAVEKEMSSQKNKYSKSVDENFKEFIALIEEKINLENEIKTYYRNDEYKKDNFSKGKLLNEKYLLNRENTEKKYKEVYNIFFEIEKIVINNAIITSELNGLAARVELFKSSELLKMFSKEFYVSKLDFDESKIKTEESIIVIKEEDKENYINGLKSIQKTLDKTISNMEKIDKTSIEKEKLNIEKYNEILAKIKEISQLTRDIIVKLEKNEDNDLRGMISKYNSLNFESGKEFFDLLK